MKNKKFWIWLIVFAGLVYLGGRLIYYGSITRSCIYTEKKVSVPQELLRGRIIVAKDAYLATGEVKENSCLSFLGSIDREIVNPETINDDQLGKSFYANRGQRIEKLEKGTIFQLVDVVASNQHGITTIDSSGGPYYYLILKDERNKLYQMDVIYLGGINDWRDTFLAFKSDDSDSANMQLLSVDSFAESEFSQEESIAYTGKLIDLKEDDLKSTEPEWKRLMDRLEKGEKFVLSVSIKLQDDQGRLTRLSDNQAERIMQVAGIQDEFLKKIPSNIPFEKLEKDQYHPYISVEANQELIDYLVDNKFDLKLESLGELTKR